jgi:hypothetical protein
LVKPLFDSWAQFAPQGFVKQCLQNILSNRGYWESILNDPTAIPAFKIPETYADIVFDSFYFQKSRKSLDFVKSDMHKKSKTLSSALDHDTEHLSETDDQNPLPLPTSKYVKNSDLDLNNSKPPLRPVSASMKKQRPSSSSGRPPPASSAYGSPSSSNQTTQQGSIASLRGTLHSAGSIRGNNTDSSTKKASTSTLISITQGKENDNDSDTNLSSKKNNKKSHGSNKSLASVTSTTRTFGPSANQKTEPSDPVNLPRLDQGRPSSSKNRELSKKDSNLPTLPSMSSTHSIVSTIAREATTTNHEKRIKGSKDSLLPKI